MTENTRRVKPDDVIPPDGDSIQGRQMFRDAALMLPNLVKLVGRLLVDPRVPRRAKVVLGFAADATGVMAAVSRAFRQILQVGVIGTGAYLAIHGAISPGAMGRGFFSELVCTYTLPCLSIWPAAFSISEFTSPPTRMAIPDK